MRTLKKTLCLVLCLAMMVGLCAVGASAIHYGDYPDTEEVKYVEAVTLLTELGVLEGDEGGFRPNDTLTRAEAAKLVVALQNINPSGLTSTFTDMADAAWAQPYVGWLEAQKIVEGVGGGKFLPGETLKFVDFAAMLLRTLGYDKDRELMTGKTYELGVLKLVNKLNLAAGIKGYEYDAPITRQEAAQLAFNALFKNMVDYKESKLANVSVDENGNLLPGLREAIPNAAYSYLSDSLHAVGQVREYGDERFDAETMLERYWPNVKLLTFCEEAFDPYGVPLHVYFMGNNQNDYVYTPAKEICTCEGIGVMAVYTTDAATVLSSQIFVDGNLVKETDLDIIENGWVIDDEFTASQYSSAKLGYGGATVLLVDGDGDDMADTLIVKYCYIGVVTDIIPADESASGQREIELTIYNNATRAGVAQFVSEVNFITDDDYSKYDYVLVYPQGDSEYTALSDEADFEEDGIIEVKPVETRDGTLTKVGMRAGKKTSLTVGGEVSTMANFAYMGLEGMTVPASDYNLNTKLVLYMSNGYVMGVEGEAPSYAHYVFKINDGYKTGEDVTLPSYDATSRTRIVGIVKQDATTDVLTLASDAEMPAMGWYIPRTVSGATTFIAPSGKAYQVVTQGLTKIAPNSPIFGNDGIYQITADAKTEFVFYTATGYKHYTGLSNIPTYEMKGEGEAAKVYGLMVGGIAKAIFVDIKDPNAKWTAKTVASPSIYVLSASASSVEYDDVNGVNVYSYRAIVDGKIGSVKASTDALGLAAHTLYEPTYSPATGYLAKVADPANRVVNNAWGKVTLSNGTFIINLTVQGTNLAYATDANTKVYYVNDDNGKTVEGGAAAEITGKEGYITAVVSAKDGLTISEIYVYYPNGGLPVV